VKREAEEEWGPTLMLPRPRPLFLASKKRKGRPVVQRTNLERKASDLTRTRRGHAMVHNPTVGTVQTTEFSKLSAQSAPFVYFDRVVTAGVHHGTVQLELGASTLVPTPDSKVASVHVITAHLRCNASAAADLRKAIDNILLLLAPTKGGSS
jgi:hypothetical protein